MQLRIFAIYFKMILIESIWQSVDDMIYINYKHIQRLTHTHPHIHRLLQKRPLRIGPEAKLAGNLLMTAETICQSAKKGNDEWASGRKRGKERSGDSGLGWQMFVHNRLRQTHKLSHIQRRYSITYAQSVKNKVNRLQRQRQTFK